MKRGLFLLSAVIFCFSIFGQDTTNVKSSNADLPVLKDSKCNWHLGIATGMAYVRDMDFVSIISSEYNISPKISAGITYGFIFENVNENFYFLRLKYRWRNNNCQRGPFPFVGLSYGRIGLITDGDRLNYIFFEIPLGVSYLFKSGLQASAQLNCYFIYDQWGQSNPNLFQTPIGISYTSRFGLYTSLSLSYFLNIHNMEISHFGPNVLLKLGWRFNLRK